MEIITDTEQFKGGWFIGAFNETAYKTNTCEIAYKIHLKDENWPNHYHKLADEINYLIEGSMTINEILLKAPTIFIIKKNESAVPKFLTDCKLIVVKIPGILNDKYIID